MPTIDARGSMRVSGAPQLPKQVRLLAKKAMYDIAVKAFASTQPITLAALRCAAEAPIAAGTKLPDEQVKSFGLYTANNFLNRQKKRALVTRSPDNSCAYFLSGMPDFG